MSSLDAKRAELHERFPSLGYGEREWFAILKADNHLYFAILGDMAHFATRQRRSDSVSEREVAYLQKCAEGLTLSETAAFYGVKEDTVKTVLGNARSRLGAKNTTHAVAIAFGEGLLEAPGRHAA